MKTNNLNGVLIKLPVYSGNFITLNPEEEIVIETEDALQIAFYEEVCESFNTAYPILECKEEDEPEPEPSKAITLMMEGETPIETNIIMDDPDTPVLCCFVYNKTLDFVGGVGNVRNVSIYCTPLGEQEFGENPATRECSLWDMGEEDVKYSGIVAAPWAFSSGGDAFMYVLDKCNISNNDFIYDETSCVLALQVPVEAVSQMFIKVVVEDIAPPTSN